MKYIKKIDTNFGSYITYRIKEILSNSDINQWSFIPISFNVVEDATKCINVSLVKSYHWWVVGPDLFKKNGFALISKVQNMR